MHFPRFALLSALVASATADFSIVSPSQDVWWVAKSINTLTWNCQDPVALSHPTFTVLVNSSSLTAPLAIIGIENNYVCSQTITQDQLTAPAGTGYTILFANTLNQTEIWATSEPFEIKALGSAYPTTTPGIGSSTAAGASATSGSSAAKSTATTVATKGNGAIGLKAGGVLGVVGAVLGLVL